MQFLYRDGDELHLMDNSSYEQIAIASSLVENDDLLAPNTDVQVLLVRDSPIRVELPTFVELAVTRTDPGVKGDTVSNVTKPAEVETGATIDVPLFVNEGDRLKIDTRTREYSARA
jgi:elongation factor P